MSRTRARGASLLLLTALVIPSALFAGCGRSKSRARPTTTASGKVLPAEDDYSAARIAEFDLTSGVPEQRATALFKPASSEFYDLIDAAKTGRESGKYAGVLVKFGSTRLGWARAEELGRTFKQMRDAGLPVYCHADELGNSTYMVAAQGCEKIWVSPAGGVDTVGIASEMVFAHDLLGKLGIEADVLQVGKYKGTGEMLTRSSASEEVKQSVQGALSSIRTQWLDEATKGRNKSELLPLLEAGPYAPSEAKGSGLIDEIGYAHDAHLALRERVMAGPTEPLFGGKDRDQAGKGGGFIGLVRAVSGAKRSSPSRARDGYVALLRASGSIVMERSGGPLGGSSGIIAKTMLAQIKALADDDDAKAVVLRIDSPGGSALASDLLWHELVELRKTKPVIVSVGDMAASGGYYMACAGSKIVAERTSILGSIGVVGGKVALAGALERVGVNTEIVPADPSSDGRRAAYESMMRKWDEPTRERVLSTMTSVYDLFLQRVAEGRKVGVEKVATYAEGRIWSGVQAEERGMIDALGGLDDAIALARNEVRPGADLPVVVVGGEGGLFEMLLGQGDEVEGEAMAQAAVARLLPFADEATPFIGSLAPFAAGERALVAMPFALLVR